MALDRLGGLRRLETGDDWVLSMNLETAAVRLEVADDYRDHTLSFLLFARDEADLWRVDRTLAGAGYVLERSSVPTARPGWCEQHLVGAVVVEDPSRSAAALADLFTALDGRGAAGPGSPARAVPDLRGTTLRSVPTGVAGVGKWRRVAPVAGRVTLTSRLGRVAVWPRLGTQIPWLVRVTSPVPARRYQDGASPVRWVRDQIGPLTCSSTICWREATMSAAGHALPAITEVMQSIGDP